VTFHLGFSTGNFGHIQPNDISNICQRAGIKRVELWDDYAPLNQVKDVKQLTSTLVQESINVVSIHASCQMLHDPQKYLRHFQDTCARGSMLNVEYIVLHPYLFYDEEIRGTKLAGIPQTWSIWEQLVVIAQDYGVPIAWENLPNYHEHLPGLRIEEIQQVVHYFNSAPVLSL
jgi:sugar phosphate isomerase/epimerase